MSEQIVLMIKETVQGYIKDEQKGNRFPISLSDTYQVIGYTRKDNALRTLLSSGMVEGQDLLRKEEMLESGKTSIDYLLSIECFKHLCMMSKTEIGYQVRQYFIDVEKAYRKMLTLNSLNGVMVEINQSQKEYGEIITGLMTKIETDPDSISQKDLDAALVANRLGLAYNKRLKAFQMLIDPSATGKTKTNTVQEKTSIFALEVNGRPMCYRIVKNQPFYDAKNLAKILDIPVDSIEHDLVIDERPYLSHEKFNSLLSQYNLTVTRYYCV